MFNSIERLAVLLEMGVVSQAEYDEKIGAISSPRGQPASKPNPQPAEAGAAAPANGKIFQTFIAYFQVNLKLKQKQLQKQPENLRNKLQNWKSFSIWLLLTKTNFKTEKLHSRNSKARFYSQI